MNHTFKPKRYWARGAFPNITTEETQVKPISLTLTKRANDIHCCLTGDSKVWDCGTTPLEAIGRWVITHGRERGIAVDHTHIEPADKETPCA